MREYSFEKLKAWQLASSFTFDIYALTKRFPSHESFGIISQMRRASMSICCNIAEGTSRTTPKEQARFSSMSYSSLMEVLNLIIICMRLYYISESQYLELRSKIEELSYTINALRESQLKSSRSIRLNN